MCKPADAGWIQEQWCHPGWSAMHPCWQAMLQSIKMVCKFQGALLSTLHHACEHLASQECCAYATSLCQVWSWMLRRLEWGERCCRFGIMKGSEPQKLQIQDSKPHQPPDKMDPVPFACFLCLDGEGSWSSHTHQSQKHSPKCSHGSRKHPLVALDAWIWMASWDPKPKNKKKGFLGHLALAGRWVAYAGGQGFWIQDPKSTEKIHMRWKWGSGRPLVLKSWDTHLKLWKKNNFWGQTRLARAEGGCFMQACRWLE